MTNERKTALHPADLLVAAVRLVGSPVCVGIDPVLDRLPQALQPAAISPDTASSAICTFSCDVIEAIKDIVPAVKVQAACFERYGAPGYQALTNVLQRARQAGVVVILDAKRGDIGISASHYAHGAFKNQNDVDWITVNGYLGMDGVEPFATGGGAFVLVRTSNPGGDAFQSQMLADGRSIAQAMADLVSEAGDKHLGEEGFSSIGAVVGATKRDDAIELRKRMPRQLFLVPGYGAQGGTADDIRACFHDDGSGALVTASRSVTYAFSQDAAQFTNSIREAAQHLADDVGRATGWR